MSSATFAVHENPAWRERANFIVRAALAEDGHYEQLWCRQIGSQVFEVCCIPFFMYDFALGDLIETRAVGRWKYSYAKVVQRSGRFVFRAHFLDGVSRRDKVMATLSNMGALLEESSPSLISVDVVNNEHAIQIAKYLNDQEARRVLVFQTGRTV